MMTKDKNEIYKHHLLNEMFSGIFVLGSLKYMSIFYFVKTAVFHIMYNVIQECKA